MSQSLEKPYFDRTTGTLFTAPGPGHFVKLQNPVFLFDDDLKECPRNTENRISTEFALDEIFWSPLQAVDRNLKALFERGNIFIGVGAFPFSDLFQGLFLRDTPRQGKKTIALDCRLFASGGARAALAHELVHAYFSDFKLVPSWQEEMLAQLVDSRYLPPTYEKLNALKNETHLPSVLEEQRPFSSLRKFSMNLLFVRYLVGLYGEEIVVESLKPSPYCSDRTGLGKIVCLIQRHRNSDDVQWKIQDAKSLLKTFAAALTMNLKDSEYSNLFSIDGWEGFQTNPLDHIPKINPNTFVRVDRSLLGQIKQRDNVFRLLWNEKDFLILEGGKIKNPTLWKKYHIAKPEHDELILFSF